MGKLILLQNLEPQYKKLALEKLRMYHELQGDTVLDYVPIMAHTADIIYCSSIFDFTDKSQVDPRAICGGSGFDDYTTEPYKITRLPSEVEKMNPRMNWDYTTIGCPRKCPWCIQWKREGTKVIPIKDIYDIWDGKSKGITLMDNNILAAPQHFYKICEQLIMENLKVDFNQGLDIRLVNDDVARVLKSLRHFEYHFAFDTPEIRDIVKEKIELLKRYGINRSAFYVLCEFNTTMQQDVKRLMLLKSLGQKAYVMKYKRQKHYIPLARWANNHGWFHSVTFEEFVGRPENQYYIREPAYRIKEWIDIFRSLC